uniref:Putative secreted protein n=1 Tax=Anopheles triannulatus TaxID=58253 RepID=A0A2M4B1C3_9DIPT
MLARRLSNSAIIVMALTGRRALSWNEIHGSCSIAIESRRQFSMPAAISSTLRLASVSCSSVAESYLIKLSRK